MASIADPASLKTPATRRDIARRLGLTGFGHWWAAELAATMPARLRAALLHRRARPVLAFDGMLATLWRPSQSNGRVGMVEAARIPLDGDPQAVVAGGRHAIASLGRGAEGEAPEVVVALPLRASLRKRLTLPSAIEGNLHQALGYDLDRHTPFKPDELYYDAVVVDRDPAHNALQVELGAARRAIVDPMLRYAESFGARVVGVSIDPPAATVESRLDLLPAERPERAAGARWLVVVPALLVTATILAALALPVWQKREEAIALNEQSEAARQRAGASDALRTELERRVGDYNFALERKYAFPGTVQALEDITHILPDDTWLTQLELRTVRGKDGQRELSMRGESANAGRLVSLLEESKLFTQAAPRSPTTKIQPGPGEIFDVGAQLKPLPAPTPMPLDVTAPPPPAARAPMAARPAPTARPAAAPVASSAVPPAATPTPAPGATPPPAAPVEAPSPRRAVRSAPPPMQATNPGAPATPMSAPPAAAVESDTSDGEASTQ